jgi:hypothetical protein
LHSVIGLPIGHRTTLAGGKLSRLLDDTSTLARDLLIFPKRGTSRQILGRKGLTNTDFL